MLVPTQSLKHFFFALNNQTAHLNIYTHMYAVSLNIWSSLVYMYTYVCSFHLIYSLPASFMKFRLYICGLCTTHDMHLHPQLMLVSFYFQGCLPTPASFNVVWPCFQYDDIPNIWLWCASFYWNGLEWSRMRARLPTQVCSVPKAEWPLDSQSTSWKGKRCPPRGSGDIEVNINF